MDIAIVSRAMPSSCIQAGTSGRGPPAIRSHDRSARRHLATDSPLEERRFEPLVPPVPLVTESARRAESRSLDRSVIPALPERCWSKPRPPRSRSRGTSRSSVRDCRSRAKARCHGHQERGKIVP
jgi:hypothetical protein